MIKDAFLTILAKGIRAIGLTIAGLVGIAIVLLMAMAMWRVYLFASELNVQGLKDALLGGGAGLLFVTVVWWSCVAFEWATDYLEANRRK